VDTPIAHIQLFQLMELKIEKIQNNTMLQFGLTLYSYFLQVFDQLKLKE
jgi:hypothetical protein